MLSRDDVLRGLTLLAQQLDTQGIEVTIHVIENDTAHATQ